MTNPINFGDKEMLTDALGAQKAITSGYNVTANECASTPLKNEIMNLLSEEHKIEHDIFAEMQKRGWYQTEAAPQDKIAKAKQKYGKQQ